jgi:hypothetical protein
MNALWVSILLLADGAPNPADVKQGWLGFVVFISLAIAVVLLWLSMRRHLKKIDFEEQPPTPRKTREP